MEGHSDLLQPIAEIAPELWILSHHSSHIETPTYIETPALTRNQGKAGFYEGRTATLIAEQFQANGGLIDEQDLAEYEAVERKPVTVSYRGYEVHSMGPPSSGGVAIAQLLNAAEMKPIDRMGFNSSATVHYVGEAMRRVFADRAKWLGDPDHVDVPTEGLLERSEERRVGKECRL